MSILEGLVDGNVDDLAPHFPKLIPLVMQGLKSELISERLVQVLLKLR